MKQFLLFGWTILLFIICCPGIVLEPYKHKNIGILLHCLVFTTLFYILYNHVSATIEGLVESDDDSKFKQAKNTLASELKKIQENNMTVEEQIEKTKEVFDKIFADWDEKDKQSFQDKYENFFKENFDVGDNENLEYVLNNASPEKIKFIDSLTQTQQEALEKIYTSMDQKEIDKVLELENDEFKKLLTDIINKQ